MKVKEGHTEWGESKSEKEEHRAWYLDGKLKDAVACIH